MTSPTEVYIFVDVESAGPIPGEYSMLALGACVVGRPKQGFYVELRPINDAFVEEALRVGGFSMDAPRLHGSDPATAMRDLKEWVQDIAGGARIVFVGFNASFDWSFVNWYFHKFPGEIRSALEA